MTIQAQDPIATEKRLPSLSVPPHMSGGTTNNLLLSLYLTRYAARLSRHIGEALSRSPHQGVNPRRNK
jgi:hypothetical protein